MEDSQSTTTTATSIISPNEIKKEIIKEEPVIEETTRKLPLLDKILQHPKFQSEKGFSSQQAPNNRQEISSKVS